MKTNKLISSITVIAMTASVLPSFAVSAADDEVYSCDFTQLVKNGADTTYGTATDIYKLDDYTTAYLTYADTYVSADGKVYLKSNTVTNGAGRYAKGSYIAFTAPSKGSVSIKGADIGVCINDGVSETYAGYGPSLTYEMTEGQTLYAGYRKVSTYVSELTFTPSNEPDATEVPVYTAVPDGRVELYSENFESYDLNTAGGWTTPAGTLAVKQDTTTVGINKYLTVTSGKSGTARSGYKEITAVKDNFVLEADVKSTAYGSNVSAFEVLENKGSLYMNHGCYSNANYAFKMNRPLGLNKYVINNKVSDSGLALDRYDQPAVLTNEIPDTWLHLKVIGNFADKTATAYLTSIDGTTTYYHGRTDMSEGMNSFALLALLAPSSGVDMCIDNIRITKATDEDLSEVFYTATIDDGITAFDQYVYTGESVVNIPDMSVYGKYFLGWRVNGQLYSSAELAKLPITSDVNITAEVSADYIENIASVAFNSFPADGMLTMGPDGDTYADNEISLTITGERGTSLVSSPDSRVTDYTIDWKFDGFRTMDGTPTGESGSSYCDSYGSIEINEAAQSSVNFRLKNTSANYYGTVTATVTYNGKSITVSKPLVLLADTSVDSSQILPKPGYIADFGKYESGLVGYKITNNDVLTGGWSIAGSDGSTVELKEESGVKYLSASRALTGNSSYIYNTIGNITSQTVFSQDIRFGMEATLEYCTGKAVTEISSTAFTLALSGSALKLNNTDICTASTNKWYHIEICADPTSKLCWAKVYDYRADGNYSSVSPLGETGAIAFTGNYTSGEFYRITLSKNRGSIDFNNVAITAPKVESVSINAPETVNIPTTGTATADFTLTANMADGNAALGMAEWKIDDEFAEGVSIESTGTQSATLTVDSTASSGELPIKVTINGYSEIKTIKLLGTKDNVAFAQAPTGAAIPVSGSATYSYKAEVINGNAETVDGRAITYALYNAEGTAELNAAGISIAADGTLTVTSAALPQLVCVKASSTDANGNAISKTVKVSVYGNKFSFGTTAISGAAQVSAADEYSDNRGYGITGAATDNAGYISGNGIGFKVKAEAGNVYNVKIKYEGTIRCEYINSNLTGFERTKDSLGEDTYTVAVFGDGIMDITLAGEGKIASLEFTKVEKTAGAKPSWWTIGDSTIQQNGSWAYNLVNSVSSYPKLAGVIDKFYNSGRAGRQHRSYYSEGLFNDVLCGIKPGDVVSISGMGTNDSGASKETFKEYNNIYIDAIEAMGGYVILGSYTPTGNYGATEGKVYDADNIIFKGMRNNSYDAAIREVYAERVAAGDERIIGFIDIGKVSDNLMTNDVRIEYNKLAADGKSIIEARAAANTKAEEMMGWWKDYNHYYDTFSQYILPEITNRAAQLIAREEQDALPEVIELASIDPNITPAPTATPKPTPTPAPTATPTPTPKPIDGTGVEVVSSDEYVDVSSLVMYGNTTYRMYAADGTYTSVSATDGKVHNTTGGEVIVVPEYKFEFTNLASSTDPYINGYVKVGANSYAAAKGYGLTSADYSINANGCKPVSGAPIKVDVPKGYYDITVYRVGGSRADVYAEGSQIIQNTTSSSSQNRAAGSALMHAPGMMIESGSADITFGNTQGNNERIASVQIVRVPEKYRKPVIWIAGDSESANYYPIGADDLNSEKIMMTGFGMQLDKYLSDKYSIANFGQPSATAGTWNDESLDAVSKRMVSGDTILICFGINDAVSSSNKVDIATAKANIKKIVDAALAKGVKPILLSPVYNGKYQGKSYFTYTNKTNELGEYAKEIGVDFIDVNRFTMKYVNDAIAATEDSNWITNNYHVADNLHLTQHSAMLVASIICAGMEDLGYAVSDYTYTYSDISSVGEGNIRGTETGITRVYSVAEAHKLMEEALATPKPESNVLVPYTAPSTTWTFNAAKPATSGNNVPVVSGSAAWSELNGNVQFNAETKDTGRLTVNLEPRIKNNVCVEFDLHMAALGGQSFAYTITDTEGNKLVSCDFDAYYGTGELAIAGTVIATGGEFTSSIPNTKGDGMGATPVHVKNTIDYTQGKVTIKIGNTEFTGALTGSETGDVSMVDIQSYRSKTAARHIYLDNLTISEEEKADETPAPTPEVDVNNINVLKTYIDEANVGVTIADGFEGTAIAALYDGEGRVEAVKMVTDNTKANTIMFDKPEEMNGYIKLFGWEMSQIKPYDDAVTIPLADITTPTSDSVESFEYAIYESTMPYRYYLPVNYNTNEKYPVIVYLHAETRTGTDNEGQLFNAQYMFNELLSEENITKYPAILVAPQCGDTDTWTSDNAAKAVSGIVNELKSKFSVDSDRIYLAGYSMGGSGCYSIAAANPGMFAALLPAGGECDTVTAQQIAAENTAVMAFHGSADETVSADKAREVISAMIAGGASNAEFCEFYGEGHNVQELSAKAQGVYEWLFERSLSVNSANEEKVVDLAIFMGQSNMAGRGNYEEATICPVGHGYEFRSITAPDVLCNIAGPFGKNENNSTVNDNSGQGIDRRTGDMVSSIMESYYQSTGTPIVGVQCSRGGTNIGYWTGSAVRAEAQSRLTAAKTYLEDNGYTINKIFMVWCQGESDGDKIHSGSQSTSGYKSSTLSVFNYMKEVGVTDMFIVQTGHYNGSDDADGKHDEAYVAIHDAQAELAAENENVYVVGSLLEYKANMIDSYHFNQSAYNEVGTAAGKAIAQMN